MPIPSEATALENRYVGPNGEPTLAAAYKILKFEWDKGDRDRELGLRLMFIAWYGLVEPPHLTGFTESADEKVELNHILLEVHNYFEDKMKDDAEMIYAFGLMASMQWFMFEKDTFWRQIGINYKKRYRVIEPKGLDPSIFKGRGAYGEYYGMQAKASMGPNGY